jgi:hypothetical protein
MCYVYILKLGNISIYIKLIKCRLRLLSNPTQALHSVPSFIRVLGDINVQCIQKEKNKKKKTAKYISPHSCAYMLFFVSFLLVVFLLFFKKTFFFFQTTISSGTSTTSVSTRSINLGDSGASRSALVASVLLSVAGFDPVTSSSGRGVG